jgi:hypothetical protein
MQYAPSSKTSFVDKGNGITTISSGVEGMPLPDSRKSSHVGINGTFSKPV